MNPPAVPVVSSFVDAILASLQTIANVGRLPGSIEVKKQEECHIVATGGNTSPANVWNLPGSKMFHKSHMLFVWYLQANAANACRSAVGFYCRVPISPGASQVKDPDAMLFFGTDATTPQQLRAFSAKSGTVTKIQTADAKLGAGTDVTWQALQTAPFSQLVFPAGNATCFDVAGHNDPALLATGNVVAVEVYRLSFCNVLLRNELQLVRPTYPEAILKWSRDSAQFLRDKYRVEGPFRVYVLGQPRNGKSSFLLSLFNTYAKEAGVAYTLEYLAVNHGGQHGTTALEHFSMKEKSIDLDLVLTDVYGVERNAGPAPDDRPLQKIFAGHYKSKSLRGDEEKWPASDRKPPHLIIGVTSAESFCKPGNDALIAAALGDDGFLRRNAQSSFIHHNVLLIITKWDDPQLKLDANTSTPTPHSLATSPFIANRIEEFSNVTGIPAVNIIPTINFHSQLTNYDKPQVYDVNRFILERMWRLIADNLAWNKAKQQSLFAENVCLTHASTHAPTSSNDQEPIAAPSVATDPISAATSAANAHTPTSSNKKSEKS